MKKIVAAALLTIALILSFALPVSAQITATFTTSVKSCFVARNTIEAGDMTYIFHYDLHTTDPLPTTPATYSFMFRLYDTDGVTLLAMSVPFSYQYLSYGYQEGVSSFYFTAAEVTALGLAWEDAVKLNIAGSPAYFTTLPAAYTYTVQAVDYCASTDQTDNQNAVKDYILTVSDPLEISATAVIALKGSTDSGTCLTTTGEYYFRGAVLGIQAISPQLFYVQYYVPEPTDMGYDLAQRTVYTNRLAGTDIETGVTNTGALLGMTGANFLVLAFGIICLALIIFLTYKGWGVEPGLNASGLILMGGGLLFGRSLFDATLIFTLLGGIFIFFSLWLKRA